MSTPVRVGLIGRGNISDIYLTNSRHFPDCEIVACADLLPERARARALEHHIPRGCTVEELLADPPIDLVINLTIPEAPADVALAAIASGKSVYNEKPLTISREDGQRILAAARSRGVLAGAAPVTFLGACIQTWHGHESLYPDPAFYYQAGGGPMFDMGPTT